MRGTLVLSVLSVRSSYALETEEPLRSEADTPDTIQWWISSDQVWRIKTYAIDHDIHTHSIEYRPNMLELAISNNAKNYGDVIASQHVLEFKDCTNQGEIATILGQAGLVPRLEVATGRFAFWKPDDAKYRSQTEPK